MFAENIIRIIFQALDKLLVSNMGLDENIDEDFDYMSRYNDHDA